MDKETRNRIQAATQKARALLEVELGAQLEGTYDIRPDGTVGGAADHLSSAEAVVRDKLIAAVEHHLATGASPEAAVADYLRETAFTTLNRFVALKMLEARGLLLECVSSGEQSSGFKEYAYLGLADGLIQFNDHGYRLYVESLFDEISLEVGILFDRRDALSLLWPRPQAILDLLCVLNDERLTSAWADDETVGWVYQYFNSDEERRTMRDPKLGVSQLPRNSRELAVRNQFFTPRYVVEFLTDNTLGRTWYEMCEGRTAFAEVCRYLVRYPGEAFPVRDDTKATDRSEVHLGSVAEELRDRAGDIPLRAKKDPRDLKVLDPACGSGHFLLYAFDLFEIMYREAWGQGDTPISDASGQSLRDDYPTLEALDAAVPGLILACNLYGIDIDPRCAQIAAFALWMRSQRAFKEAHVEAGSRAPIVRTNIVVAEPIPGGHGVLAKFALGLEPELRELVQFISQRMAIAGEAGSLLRIEEDVRRVVRDISAETGGLFADVEQEGWRRAEDELMAALKSYAAIDEAGSAYARQLFEEDAARGLAFIDVCRQRYDVVLTNPPFGAGSEPVEDYCRTNYASASKNLAAAFVSRGHELLSELGCLGAIVDTTILQKSSYTRFRKSLVLKDKHLAAFGWLGWEVLDAQVDASVLVLRQNGPSDLFLWVDGRSAPDECLRDAVAATVSGASTDFSQFRAAHSVQSLPNSALTADPSALVSAGSETFRQRWAVARQGVAVPDAARFIRLHWEVPHQSIGAQAKWSFLSHGGEFSPFYRDYGFVVDWEDDGARIKTDICVRYPYLNGNWGWVARNSSYYRQPGLAYGKRTDSLNTQVCPAGFVFSNEGSGIFPLDADEVWAVLAVTNSPAIALQLNSFCGQHKYSGYVDKLVVPTLDPADKATLEHLAKSGYVLKRRLAATEETSVYFVGVEPAGMTVREYVANQCRLRDAARVEVSRIQADIDRVLFPQVQRSAPRQDRYASEYSAANLVSYALGRVFGRWSSEDVTANAADDIALVRTAFDEVSVRGASTRDAPSILVRDPGHAQDMLGRIGDELNALFSGPCHDAIAEVAGELSCNATSTSDFGEWMDKNFFSMHLAQYSLGRRKAPIYWQLATPSCSYSVWLYYHCLSGDTLFQVLNDFVVPKLLYEERRLAELRTAAGTTPSASQRKETAGQQKFVDELRVFRDEIARVAPMWCPDLNDGVIINFAPLWRLVPHHRAWQKQCRACWNKLTSGDYDWAHLAIHLWPERVVPKCAQDRSLAIAHDLEDVFWFENDDGGWTQREVDSATVDRLVQERSSAAVKSALAELLAAG